MKSDFGRINLHEAIFFKIGIPSELNVIKKDSYLNQNYRHLKICESRGCYENGKKE